MINRHSEHPQGAKNLRSFGPPGLRMTLTVLLFVSLFAFAIDLFHMIYHLADEPALFKISGVTNKLVFKLSLFLIPFWLWIRRGVWLKWLVIFFVFSLPASEPALALPTGCKHARELLEKSGTARDASENIFGRIKTKPPYGSFPQDMDKITWWGTFKPFEFWESPKFESVWINPEGKEAARNSFRGNKCRLAKDTLKAEDQPRGEFQPGMWNVIVTCDDYLIDKQTFAILAPAGSQAPSDAPTKSQETAMIWAKDEVN